MLEYDVPSRCGARTAGAWEGTYAEDGHEDAAPKTLALPVKRLDGTVIHAPTAPAPIEGAGVDDNMHNITPAARAALKKAREEWDRHDKESKALDASEGVEINHRDQLWSIRQNAGDPKHALLVALEEAIVELRQREDALPGVSSDATPDPPSDQAAESPAVAEVIEEKPPKLAPFVPPPIAAPVLVGDKLKIGRAHV